MGNLAKWIDEEGIADDWLREMDWVKGYDATTLTQDMVDDIITAPVDDQKYPVLSRDIYDYYNDHIPIEVAVMELGEQVENYVSGEDMS